MRTVVWVGAGACVLSAIGVVLYQQYIQTHYTENRFYKDFLVNATDFNRTLNAEERGLLGAAFPNANFGTMRLLGLAGTRPTDENCKFYECSFQAQTVNLYDANMWHQSKQAHLVKTIKISGRINETQDIYDQCHSGQYLCFNKLNPGMLLVPHMVQAATYNCIGHALGISKWLDPREIDARIQQYGMSKKLGIEAFLKDKKAIYNSTHESNFGKIVDKLHYIPTLPQPIKEHSVAFFFDSANGDCTHGARYLEKFSTKEVGGSWTSKLGSLMTISHELKDLIGPAYGDDYQNYAGT